MMSDGFCDYNSTPLMIYTFYKTALILTINYLLINMSHIVSMYSCMF